MFIRDTYSSDVQKIIAQAQAERRHVIMGMCLAAVNTVKSLFKLPVVVATKAA